MHHVLLLGAGKIGQAIAKLLGNSGDYDVVVCDVEERALERLKGVRGVTTRCLDSSDASALGDVMKGRQSVVSALSYAANPIIARAALANGLSYFDLTEDVETTRAVHEVANSAKPGQIFMPQCGLAPGFIAIAGYHLTKGFDRLDEVRMRVGALTKYPTNRLRYNLTWSTDGLINEYCNPCEIIWEGKRREVLPLEALEHFSLDGVDYEAFNTSGGVGSLWDTLNGKVRNLDYKTVRYLGHRDLMSFLVNDLRLSTRREVLKDILENAVPVTLQDVVLIFCTVTGWKDNQFTQVSDARKVYHREVHGEMWSAIQITTAAGICAALDLHASGKLKGTGFTRQEEITLPDFLGNRFGSMYNPVS